MQQDIKKVFMNPEEFGEEHIVDNEPMNIIIDNMEHIEREKRETRIDEGLFNKQVLFYVSKEKFGKLPKIGRKLELDKQIYLVTDAINEDGIYSISLEATRS